MDFSTPPAPGGDLAAKKLSLGTALGWLTGIAVAIAALGSLIGGNFVSSLALALAVGYLIPPIYASLRARMKQPMTRGGRIAAVALLLVLGAWASPDSPAPATPEEAAVAEAAPSGEAAASSTDAAPVDAALDGQMPAVAAAPIAEKSATEGQPAVAPAPTGQTYYPVTQVIDGDTFKIQKDGKEVTLRLIGIDTPETVDPRKPVQCFGREASAEAKRLLVGQKVRIEADASQDTYDKYGRTLAYAYLTDGMSFNEHMIRQGFAHEYTYEAAYKYQAAFRAAEKEAEAAGRGLWATDACGGDTASAPAPAAAPEAAPAPSGHTFYTSSHHSARYYYCDTDEQWEGLSKTYLKSYPSAAELLAAFPDRTLHEDCE